jgi:hypothetical protein
MTHSNLSDFRVPTSKDSLLVHPKIGMESSKREETQQHVRRLLEHEIVLISYFTIFVLLTHCVHSPFIYIDR